MVALEPQPVSTRAPEAPPRVRSGPRRALFWYGISRLVVLAATVPAALAGDPGHGPWPTIAPGWGVVRAGARWDGAWYLWVAARGYPSNADFSHHLSDIAFFPLYPQLVRGVSAVTHLSPLVVALAISLTLGAVATVLVWHLAERVAGREIADRAVLLFVFFPGSFVLSMAYAEPVMIVATCACLLALLDRRWVLAGAAAAFATASRPNASALLVALAVVAGVELVRRRDALAPLAPVVGASGVLLFFSFLWIRTGRPFAWFDSERDAWHDHVALLTPVFRRVGGLVTHPPLSLKSGSLNDLVAVGGYAIVVAGVIVVWRRGWPLALRAYTIAALIIPSLSMSVGPRPRMLFAAFPLAILGAESPKVHRTLLIVSVVGLVVFTFLVSATLAATP